MSAVIIINIDHASRARSTPNYAAEHLYKKFLLPLTRNHTASYVYNLPFQTALNLPFQTDCKIIILIVLSVQLVILFLGKVLGFAEVHPNHPQPSKAAEVCLVQQK